MNASEVSKLTDDDVRVKIAILRGWKHEGSGNWLGPDGLSCQALYPTGGSGDICVGLGKYDECVPPDYPCDLNDIHEVEEACLQTAELQCEYARVLEKIAWDADGNVCWHATARQRSEALLMVLG